MIRRILLPLLGLVLTVPAAEARADVGIHAAMRSVAAPALTAHELGQSYLYLRVYDDSLVARVEITVADVARAVGMGWNLDGVTEADVESDLDRIRSYVESRFALSSDGVGFPLRFRNAGLIDLELAEYVTLTYLIDQVEGIPEELDVRFSVLLDEDADHRNLLVIEHNWRTATFNNEAGVSLIFSPRSPEQTLDLSSSSVLRGFIGFIWLGVWHILIGFDHILFLMALVLPSVLQRRDGRWEPVPDFRRGIIQIVAIVTFFTIAHSVTLSLAALDLVRLPSRFVESVIAGSIAVAAMASLMPKLNAKEWLIAFVFGLFHGFGFATVLGDIGMGREFLVLSLLGFNVGVEMGQVAVIALLFPVLFLLRRKPVYRWIHRIGAGVLIAVAMYWFLERSLGIDIPLVPPPLRSLATALMGA